MRALVVEDDASIVMALSDLLRSEGFQVTSTDTQAEACRLIAEQSFDIALLDVTLTQGSGFVVCTAARATAPSMPVIFLTASDDEYSTVAGLDMGAADYIAKPFRPRELISRIHSALRRSAAENNVLEAGDVRLNVATGLVTKRGAEIVLSALEYRLLLYFLQHKNRVITRENLRDAIWDSAGEYISDNALNVYMKRLREKVEDDSSDPQILVTIRGLGFKVCG